MPVWLSLVIGGCLAFAMGAVGGWLSNYRLDKEQRRRMKALVDSWDLKPYYFESLNPEAVFSDYVHWGVVTEDDLYYEALCNGHPMISTGVQKCENVTCPTCINLLSIRDITK